MPCFRRSRLRSSFRRSDSIFKLATKRASASPPPSTPYTTKPPATSAVVSIAVSLSGVSFSTLLSGAENRFALGRRPLPNGLRKYCTGFRVDKKSPGRGWDQARPSRRAISARNWSSSSARAEKSAHPAHTR